jgi:hypothetical protein
MQTISPILSSEGTDTQCINQKAHLMSEQNQLFPDWVAGLEGETVICEEVTIRLSTSLRILEGCLGTSDSEWGHCGVVDGSCLVELGIEEEQAGRGPGPTGVGQQQEDPGR